ncbi:MAG: RDD family protein [bacterium]
MSEAPVSGAAPSAQAAPARKRNLLASIAAAGRRAGSGLKSGSGGPAPGASAIPKELRRIAARLIDIIIAAAFSIPFSWLFRIITYQWMKDVGGMGYDLSLYFAGLLVGSVYFIFGEWRYGKTAGKWLLGLKVVSYGDGRKLALGGVFWRWIGFMASMFWAYIGYRIALIIINILGIFKADTPYYAYLGAVASAIAIFTIFSLGLLITFVGKYKRGFHDLLGRSIVAEEIIKERGKTSEGKS